MSAPFVYHSVRHKRKETPPVYRDYRSYKRFLRSEFSGACVYCRLPDRLKGEASFGVDHYKPRFRFPRLECDYANLFYACNGCNSSKGPFWPTRDGMRRGYYIPNPCDHVMLAHVRYRGAKVEAQSLAGECAIEVLRLNDPQSVDYRDMYLGLVKTVRSALQKSNKTLAQIAARMKSTSDDNERADLDAESVEERKTLHRLTSQLQDLIGE